MKFWELLQRYDLPNWFAVVLWPVILFLWSRRTIPNVPNLNVSLSKGKMKVGDQEGDALCLNFLNNTGSIVYLTNVCISKCSTRLQVDIASSRDMVRSSYELKFPNKADRVLTERQIILQTNEEVGSCLLVRNHITEGILSYRPNPIREIFHWPKYFCLEFMVMVGNKRYKVVATY